MKVLRIIGIFLLCVVLLLVIAVIAVQTPPARRYVFARVQSILAENGIKLDASSFRYGMFPPSVDIQGLRVSTEDSSLPPLLEADRLQLSIGVLPLIRRVIRVDSGKLEKPVLRVVLLSGNRSNLPGQKPGAAQPETKPAENAQPQKNTSNPLSQFQVGDFEIKDAAIAFRDEPANIELRLPLVDLSLGDHGFPDTKVELKTKAAGEAVAAGQLIPVESLLVKAAVSRDLQNVKLESARIEAAQAVISAEGTLKDLSAPVISAKAEASLPVALLANFAAFQKPAAGELDLQGNAEGPIKALKAKLNLSAGKSGIRLDMFTASQLSAEAAYDGSSRQVAIESLHLVSPDGSIEAQGKLALASGDSSLRARLSNVDLERIAQTFKLKFQISSRADGTLSASWPGMQFRQADGRALMRFSKLRQEPEQNRLPVTGDVEALIQKGQVTLLIGPPAPPAEAQQQTTPSVAPRDAAKREIGKAARFAAMTPAAYRLGIWPTAKFRLVSAAEPYSGISSLMQFFGLLPAQNESAANAGKIPPMPMEAIQALATVLRGRLTITPKGDLSGRLSAHVQDLGQLVASLNALTGGGVPVSVPVAGSADVQANISGNINAPVVDVQAKAPSVRVGPMQGLSADVGVLYSPTEIRVRNATIQQQDQSLRAQGTIGLTPNAPMDFQTQITNLRIATVLDAAGKKDIPVSGIFSAEGTVKGTRQQPEADFKATAANLEAYGESWGRLSLDAGMAGQKIQVRQLKVDKVVTQPKKEDQGASYENPNDTAAPPQPKETDEAKQSPNNQNDKTKEDQEGKPAGTLTASGTYDLQSGEYSLDLKTQDLRIQQVAAGGHSISGVLNTVARGQGSLDRPTLTAQLNLTDLLFDSRDPKKKMTGVFRGNVDVTSPGETRGMPAIAVRVEQLTMGGNGFDLHNQGPMQAAFNNQVVSIQPATLIVNDGRVTLGGNLPMETTGNSSGDMRLTAAIDLRSVYRLSPFLETSKATGMLNADLQVHGSVKQPLPEGTFSLQDGALNNPALLSPLDQVQVKVLFQQGIVQLQQATANWAGASIKAQGAVPLALVVPSMANGKAAPSPAELNLDVTGIQVANIAKNAADTMGTVSLHLEARAPSFQPDAITANLRFDDLNVSLGGIDIAQQGKSSLSVANGVAKIDHFELTGPDTMISSEGTVRLTGDKPIDARLNISTNAGLISAFVENAKVAGKTNVQVQAGGTLAKPDFRGFAAIEDGQFAVDTPNVAASNLNVRLEFAGDRYDFRQGSGNLNGGDLHLTGGGNFGSGGLSNTNVAVEGKDIYLDFPEGLLSVSDFNVNLTNRDELLQVGGQAAVKEGTFRKNVNLQASVINLLQSGNSDVELSGERSEFLSRVRYNVALSTPDAPIVIDDNMGKFAVLANVRLVGSYYQPSLTGRIQLDEAGQLYLNGNTFNIQRGIATFVSEQQIRPEVDLLAETKVSNYDITMSVNGPAGKITTTLTSDPPLSEDDIISVLVTGRPLKDVRGAEMQVASQQLLSYVAGGLGTALGSQLQAISGLSQVRLEPVLIAGETTPDARLTIGQNLASNLSLTYSRSVVNGGDDIWIGEYNALRSLVTKITKQADNSYRFDLDNDWQFGGTPLLMRGPSTEKRKVSGVHFTGMPVLTQRELEDKVKVKPGDKFDFFKIRKGVNRIQHRLQTRGRLEAQVRLRSTTQDQQTDLNVDVQAGPLVDLEFQGKTPPRGVRGRVRDIWEKGIFDLQRAEQAEDAIREHLAHDGYLQAKVTHNIENVGEDQKRVTFTIDPGEHFKNEGIVFKGAEKIKPKELSTVLKAEHLKDRVLIDASKARSSIERYYADHGYLSASVDLPRLQTNGNTGSIVIPISEGPLYHFETVKSEGNEAYSAREIIARAQIGQGTLYAPDVLDNAISRVQKLYTDNGYNDATVNYKLNKLQSDAGVDLVFQIDEGKQHVLREVIVDGNQETTTHMIMNQVPVQPGQVLGLPSVSRARSNLYGTGAYQLIELTHAPITEGSAPFPLSPNQLPSDLHITVHEIHPYRILAGGYYDTDRGPGVIADVSNRNSLGDARVLGLRARYDSNLHEARLYFSQPFLRQFRVRSLGETYYTKDIRQAFADDRWGATFSQEARFRNRYTINYGYRIERVQVFNQTPFALTEVPTTDNPTSPSSNNLIEGANPVPPFSHITRRVAPLIATISQDTRDDVLDATKGQFVSHGFSIGFNFMGSQQQYLKYFAQYFRYLPLSKPVPVPFKPNLKRSRLVYAGAARVGLGRGLAGQELIQSERFFAGGGTSIRGFKQDEVGPKNAAGVPVGGNATFVVNNELRFPLWRWFDGATFIDVGNVYSFISDFNPFKLRSSAGVGLRLHTPWVLLRADYGEKLNRRPGESAGAFFVSVGQAF